jgi:hypothetical protein
MATTIDGTGLITVDGTSTTQGRVRLAEDTDNGTNYIELTAPASVASNRTITLPDNTGMIITTASTFAGTGPAFSATKSANQTIASSSTWTKVTWSGEDFDTNSNFASDRFTPTVAGYYLITCILIIEVLVAQNNTMQAAIYKNGSSYRQIFGLSGPSVNMNIGNAVGTNGSAVIYLNGSTDYIEIYAFQTYGANGAQVNAGASFTGALVRAA